MYAIELFFWHNIYISVNVPFLWCSNYKPDGIQNHCASYWIIASNAFTEVLQKTQNTLQIIDNAVFYILHSLVQGLGRCLLKLTRRTFLVHRSNSGQMPFLTPPMTLLDVVGGTRTWVACVRVHASTNWATAAPYSSKLATERKSQFANLTFSITL